MVNTHFTRPDIRPVIRPVIVAAASLLPNFAYADFNINMGSSVEFGLGADMRKNSSDNEDYAANCSCVKSFAEECKQTGTELCYQLRPLMQSREGEYTLGAAIREFPFDDTIANASQANDESRALKACRKVKKFLALCH